MADNTKIEWSDATWNIITGCSVVSPGCTNCYAMRLAGSRLQHHPSRAGLTRESKAGPVWTGEVRFNIEWLTQPMDWKRPRLIFVAAHGDIGHHGVTDAMLDQIWAVMALSPQHSFQILTKRPNRLREYLTAPDVEDRINAMMNILAPAHWHNREVEDYGGLPLRNVWLGTSAEDQVRLNERLPLLLRTPAAVHYLSAEPLLGPLYLRNVRDFYDTRPDRRFDALHPDLYVPAEGAHGPILKRLDWVIAGGESGPGARPMHPDWVRPIYGDCAATGVAFLFKQWGAWVPLDRVGDAWPDNAPSMIRLRRDGSRGEDGWPMQRVGKKAAGRHLDGVLHDGMPARAGAEV